MIDFAAANSQEVSITTDEMKEEQFNQLNKRLTIQFHHHKQHQANLQHKLDNLLHSHRYNSSDHLLLSNRYNISQPNRLNPFLPNMLLDLASLNSNSLKLKKNHKQRADTKRTFLLILMKDNKNILLRLMDNIQLNKPLPKKFTKETLSSIKILRNSTASQLTINFRVSYKE